MTFPGSSTLPAALLCAGLGLVGCGAASVSAEAGIAPPAATAVGGDVERFLPLKDAWVFSYVAWLPDSPEPEQLILQVERRSATSASLRSGSSVKRVEFLADGVRVLGAGYLLKRPRTLGAEWAGSAGRVRVTAIAQTVHVQAGQFMGCLTTTEGGAEAQPLIATTYCPDVGIVTLDVRAGEREERFELKSFGPRVDVNDL